MNRLKLLGSVLDALNVCSYDQNRCYSPTEHVQAVIHSVDLQFP